MQKIIQIQKVLVDNKIGFICSYYRDGKPNVEVLTDINVVLSLINNM